MKLTMTTGEIPATTRDWDRRYIPTRYWWKVISDDKRIQMYWDTGLHSLFNDYASQMHLIIDEVNKGTHDDDDKIGQWGEH